jgi:hypothetical protein
MPPHLENESVCRELEAKRPRSLGVFFRRFICYANYATCNYLFLAGAKLFLRHAFERFLNVAATSCPSYFAAVIAESW